MDSLGYHPLTSRLAMAVPEMPLRSSPRGWPRGGVLYTRFGGRPPGADHSFRATVLGNVTSTFSLAVISGRTASTDPRRLTRAEEVSVPAHPRKTFRVKKVALLKSFPHLAVSLSLSLSTIRSSSSPRFDKSVISNLRVELRRSRARDRVAEPTPSCALSSRNPAIHPSSQ